MRYGAYQAARLDRAKGQADLILRDGTFYLYVTVDLPSPPPIGVQDVLGVDLGIATLPWTATARRTRARASSSAAASSPVFGRACRQAGTKSAKKHLRRNRRRESRYQRDVNHCISKHLVQKALVGQKALSLEDLSGIRERVTVRKTHRYERLSWAFSSTAGSLSPTSAKRQGVPLYIIDPRNTSQNLSCLRSLRQREPS